MFSSFWLRVIRNFLPAALIIVALGFIFYLAEAADDEHNLNTNEINRVHAATLLVNRSLLGVARDVRYLANSQLLNKTIQRPSALALKDVKQEFSIYLDAKPIYSKVRWIDETGQEKIHVERGKRGITTVTPTQSYQKSQRYYFNEAMKLNKGEVYLSQLDLEMEQDTVALPYHPVLRAASPVFDATGKPRGIVILTYSAEDLFQRIESVVASSNTEWMLLNQDGYWLHAPKASDEFGFILPHQARMDTLFPEVWGKLNAASAGELVDSAGHRWLFKDIYPYQYLNQDALSQHSHLDSTNMAWKMVKRIDAQALSEFHQALLHKTFIFIGIVLVLALLISIRLSGSQLSREQQEANLRYALNELEQQKFALDQHAIVFITDPNGIITYVNEKFVTTSQYSRAELLGKHHRILNAGYHNSNFFSEIFEKLAAGKVWHGEVYNRAKNGICFWINTTFVPFLDEHGKPKAYASISTDISSTKQAIEQIKQNDARLRLLLSSVAEGIYGVDTQGTCTFINAAGLKLLGYQTEAELIGRKMHDLIHHSQPDGKKHPISDCRIYNSMLINQSLHVADEVFWHQDGSYFPVEYWAHPLIEEDRTVGAVVTFFDITEQQKINERLRIAATAFETQEAIVVTDTDATIISVNHAFERITGYSAAEVLGKNPRILKSGRHDEPFYQAMWKSLLDTGTWSGEMWDKRKDGSIYPKWLTISTVRNETDHATHYVAIFMDVTERKLAEEEIHRLAFYDPLTHLPNRRLLLDRLGQALSLSQRNGGQGALLFMDMDNFKILNDTKGHDAGDLMLIEVAQRLKSCLRESDSVARLGGDEFVVILQDLGNSALLAANQAEIIADKIVAALNRPYRISNHEHHSSVSIGVCLFHGNTISMEDLLRRADTAMYQAKAAGRNGIRFFETTMQAAIESRAIMEAELRHAIDKQELQLYYQMQVDSEQYIHGAEVLLRWFNPERGFVPPSQFIPLAEESGLVLPIGQWVLEGTLQQLSEWSKKAHTKHLQLAVNVSAVQFCQPAFVGYIQKLLHRFSANPTLLKLELTESLILVDVEDAIQKMRALQAIGVQFSMDDFGTGYSSLSYLKRLPLNQIKIDQSFVRDIAIDPSDTILVKTIIDMSNNFGLEVIAEGVETSAQLTILRNSGCRLFQGYFFGKPVPLNEFERLIASAPQNARIQT